MNIILMIGVLLEGNGISYRILYNSTSNDVDDLFKLHVQKFIWLTVMFLFCVKTITDQFYTLMET